MGMGLILGQPRHCICTNALRGLSATAEFLFSSPTSAITKLQREPAQREHKYNWGGEIMKISPFISETVRDRAIVITEH